MEINVLIWIHQNLHGLHWVNVLMSLITNLGEMGIAAIIAGVVLLCIKKTRWVGVAVVIALILDFVVVNLILKNAFNRPRPWLEYGELSAFYESINLIVPTDASFPSGHSAISMAGAIAIVLGFGKKGVVAVVIAVIIALTRLFLCVHYPTDVLAGVIVGGLCGVAGHFLSKLIKNKWFNKGEKV